MDADHARRRARVLRRPAADSVRILSAAEPPTNDDELDRLAPLEAGPALARLALGAWARSAGWTLSTAVRASRRLGASATSGATPAELAEEGRAELARALRDLLGGDEGVPPASPGSEPRRDPRREESRAKSLRQRGEALLERAARVEDDAGIHPGFDRIIDQLSPDEARILQLLNGEGAKAVVYVKESGPLGIGAREVARRLSMIGREAGCMHPELVPAYLDNLVRLGLIAIHPDPIGDETAYQVLEAQPEVTEPLEAAGGGLFRGTTVRRSVDLTDFGAAFCEVCFPPPAGGDAVLDAGQGSEAVVGSRDEEVDDAREGQRG